MDLINKFNSKISKFSSSLKLNSFAVAVSGGADSLALAYLMNQWCKINNYRIINLIIDHDLRENSALEAQKTLNIIKSYSMDGQIIKWSHQKIKSNIQEQARIGRYNLLTDFCKANNYQCLLTAHHLNDQAETILMRILKGTGLYGLSGIAEISNYAGVIVLRPLLEFSKKELLEYVSSLKMDWIEDPSNNNLKFTRVKIRKFLARSNLFLDKITSLSKNLASARECIEYFVNNFIREFCIKEEDRVIFNIDNFISLPDELKFRIIGNLIQEIGQKTKLSRADRIENLVNKILQKGFKAATLGSCLIQKKQKQIIITKENLNNI